MLPVTNKVTIPLSADVAYNYHTILELKNKNIHIPTSPPASKALSQW